MQGFVKIAFFILLTTNACTPTAAGLLPDHLAHRELFLDELLEHTDMISSILYIVMAYHRGFQNLGARVCDDDGLYLLPIPTSECPILNTSFAECSSAAQGEVCTGKCNTADEADDVNNCVDPSNRKSTSIYLKSDMACKLGDEEACRLGGRVLCFIAIGSLLASIVALLPDPRQVPLMFVGGTVPAFGCVLLCAYLTSSALVALAGIFVAVLCNCFLCSLSNHEEMAERGADRRQILLNLPVISLCAACKMSPENAKDAMDRRGLRKVALRVVQDIPETLCAALDIWWFGGSWEAVLDVALSGLMILSHLPGQIQKYVDKHIAEPVDSGH